MSDARGENTRRSQNIEIYLRYENCVAQPGEVSPTYTAKLHSAGIEKTTRRRMLFRAGGSTESSD